MGKEVPASEGKVLLLVSFSWAWRPLLPVVSKQRALWVVVVALPFVGHTWLKHLPGWE